MTALFDATPDAIQPGVPALYYYGAQPLTLSRLPLSTRFSVAYVGGGCDYVVLYRVVEGRWPTGYETDKPCPPAYAMESKRPLTVEERGHFETSGRGDSQP